MMDTDDANQTSNMKYFRYKSSIHVNGKTFELKTYDGVITLARRKIEARKFITQAMKEKMPGRDIRQELQSRKVNLTCIFMFKQFHNFSHKKIPT
jgi:hypothetical protein